MQRALQILQCGFTLTLAVCGTVAVKPVYAAGSALYAIQQPAAAKVSGIVTDEKNQPLIGVNVMVKGTRRGAVTDANGRYAVTADAGATLIFSFTGYVPQEVVIADQQTVNILLREDVRQLNEVVSVGYQKMGKSDVTGAISSVKAKELNLTTPTVGQALVGKVAGVQVSQVSGAPYVSTKIRVRGVGSVNASSDPLYVIDGYPVGNDIYINPNDIETIDILKDAASAAIYGSRAAGGVVMITTKHGKEGKGQFEYDYQYGINQLSHKVKLLDADQYAQLVIDGRNNTYKDLMLGAGKTWTDAMYSDNNKTRVDNVNNAGSVQIPDYIYDFANQKLIHQQVNTDWQDELYRNAPVQRHNLSFTGGKNGMRYALSGGYQDQQGIIVSTYSRKLNLRANVDADVSPKLKVGANLSLTSNNNREVEEGRFDHGPILGALIYMPYFRAYNDDGTLRKNEAAAQSSLYGYQSIENPVAIAEETNITRKGLRATYGGYLSYELIPNLVFKANLGMQTYNEKYDYYRPTSLSSDANPPGSVLAQAAARDTARTISTVDQLGEFTLNYKKKFGKHNFDVLAGYSAQQFNSDIIGVTAKGYQNDRIEEITSKGADASLFSLINTSGKATWTMLSYFARIVYNYENKYFLTGSFRTDGSSRFGPANRWGKFPSVSAGWNVSKEPFYTNMLGTSSSLKLRASWGLSGNNNIGNYNQLQVMAPLGGVVYGTSSVVNTAIWSGDLKDDHLGWESTSQYNFGADIGLFNDRVFVIANYYISRSYNLLFNQPVSGVAGVSNASNSAVLTNLRNSKVQNKGFDIQIDSRIVSTKDFAFNLSGNISLNRNKVLDMGGASTIITAGAERSYKTHITEEGQPIGMFYGFKVKGMVRESDMANIAADNAVFDKTTQSFPKGYVLKGPPRSTASSTPLTPGDIYFEDTNGDGIVNDADKTVIGTPYPKFTYGFALNFSYKSIDLSASFNGSYGNQVLDGQDYYLFNMEGSGNQYAKVADRYRSEAQPGNGSVYRASRGGTQSNSTRLSSFYLQDGSYFRCTNITLGYNLPVTLVKNIKGLTNVRVYAAVDNAFTITKYLGYNPEVDYNAGANLTPGVDYGMYPLVRAYNFGVKATF
ncbi:TonB-dependent receptor [Chitinophaga agrisoli]|uniref:TonB-dependent receptor n=1 Tax=Chitinophaga agrisoli TaxID=2607653 RepID=A0A5B2W0M4_9BACT|nr:TonB-dependent receptor [Chitinophaga agrisoli]KAA2244905.1 TonB-dependent receptor [Chitinophaga agrisoli]